MYRSDYYIIPENFKKGNYIFNRFRVVDLVLLVGACVVGLITILSSLFLASDMANPVIGFVGIGMGCVMILLGILLTIPLPYYHNVLGKIMCILRYTAKEKTFKWKGVNYKNYEEK